MNEPIHHKTPPPGLLVRIPEPHKRALDKLAKQRRMTPQELAAVAIERLIQDETEGKH